MEEFYLYKGKKYSDMPAHTEIKSSEIIDGVMFYSVKHYTYAFHLIVLALIVVVSVMLFSIPKLNHVVNYNSTMHIKGNQIYVDMFNSIENSCPITVCIYLNDTPIISSVQLLPGEDVGAVDLIGSIEKTSNMATLEYTIEAGWRSVTESYDVLLVED